MTDWYKCPNCTSTIPHGVQKCYQCKCVLDWRQIPPTVYMLANGQPPAAMPPPGPMAAAAPSPGPAPAPVYGGITCANCGAQIIPIKSKFGCGTFALLFILGVIPGLFYLIYYAGKRVDTCPICEKNAYKIAP
jgi:hypothetical protein